jgi:hypothetical protein
VIASSCLKNGKAGAMIDFRGGEFYETASPCRGLVPGAIPLGFSCVFLSIMELLS